MRLATLLLILFSPVLLFASVLEVGAGKKYPDVHSALLAAVNGDVIRLADGIYKEDVVTIDKQLTLEGGRGAVVDGSKQRAVIVIRRNGVTVRGITVRNSGYSDLQELAGIRIENSRDCTVENVHLYDNYFGIYLANSYFCKLLNNRVEGFARTEASSGNGIHIWKGGQHVIAGNHISGHRDGIYFEFVKHTSIVGNLSELNLRYGLHFMFSDNDSYRYNTFRYNGSGVAVMYTQEVLMEHNRFENNWGSAAYGLLLKEISHSEIRNNLFIRNTTGLYMEGSNDTRVYENEFRKNGWALRILGDCFEDTITSNNFFGNSFDVATNASRSMNHFYSNYWDQYSGYDLNNDRIGDVPYHPVSLYSMITENSPFTLMLLHSFFIDILDQTEKIVPTVTPEEFRDDTPLMKPVTYDKD